MKIWILKAKNTPNKKSLPDDWPVKVRELPDNENPGIPWENYSKENYDALVSSLENDINTWLSNNEAGPIDITYHTSEIQIWHLIWTGTTSAEQQQRLIGALPAAFIVAVKLQNWTVCRALLGSYLQTNKIEQIDYDLIDGILPEA